MPGKIIASLRMVLFLLLTLTGLFFIGILSLLPWIDKKRIALEGRKIWTVFTCRVLGMEVDSRGWSEVPVYILISNHRSYIDPVITLREARAYPLAKSEISKWPLIGYAASYTGVIFVKRESQASRRNAIRAMDEALEKRFPLLVYPEGTTSGGVETIPFRLGAFRLAVQKEMPVIPCAIDYSDSSAYWVGKDTFIEHFFRFFSRPKTKVVVRYGPPMYGDDPIELMERTQHWINNELQQMELPVKREASFK